MRYAPLFILGFVARVLSAQQGQSPTTGTLTPAASRAAELITTEELGRHVAALTADSTKERGTPSRGLTQAAQYVADQFTKLGLTISLQPYPIPGLRRMSLTRSRVLFIAPAHNKNGEPLLDERGMEMRKSVAVSFADDARPGVGAIPEYEESVWGEQSAPTRMVVLSGRHTATSIARADLRQSIVLYVPPAGIDSAAEHQVVDRLRKSASVLVLSADDAATFARRRAAAGQPPALAEGYIAGAMGAQRWVAYVRADALRFFWELAGINLARARADTAPMIREVPALAVSLEAQAESTDEEGPTGINVIGVLPGTDSELVDDYDVFAAHLDNGRDGRDDNVAGVAGLLALAKAYSQPGARPRRSLIFLATSGAANDQPGFGANFFAESPTVRRIGLTVTLDDVGHGPRDSVAIDGLADADFATRPDWVAVNHPELGLAVIDGGTVSDPALEHFAFVRRAIPTLSLHGMSRHLGSGVGPSGTGDLEKAVSVTRLAYFIGQELASAVRRPKWSTLGRQYRLNALE